MRIRQIRVQHIAAAADTVSGTSGVFPGGMQWLLVGGCVAEGEIGFMEKWFSPLGSIPQQRT
ncbi:hypothetical protein E5676_scaffold943G00390 [Cucumis melo var. makuwa]|uniref:Uncharacterized protein n=1 Tax=Cucumis melo var. makuwa TaxID=1194695 RepID=A0A5A7UQF3_CUCMM|nr:hypothetical protein E6C27_scaffold104G00210 [Cucumis melo var. makuwa]TYK24069.1 hypothetical protein E5676_scaffold943G00390 [Cucumis melo var. makuwa]